MTLASKIWVVLGIALFGSALFATMAYGSVTFTTPSKPAGTYQNFTFFSATTTTATSTNTTDGGGYFVINGAKLVNLYFQRGDTSGQGNVGTTTFKIQVTPDGSNWFDYNELQKNRTTVTGDTYFTRVNSVTAGPALNADQIATSTSVYRMDFIGFYAIRCIAVETTDGEHTCKASAEF